MDRMLAACFPISLMMMYLTRIKARYFLPCLSTHLIDRQTDTQLTTNNNKEQNKQEAKASKHHLIYQGCFSSSFISSWYPICGYGDHRWMVVVVVVVVVVVAMVLL